MERKLAPVIVELIEAIEGIERTLAGRSVEDFKADWEARMAVQRAIEIVSEGARWLPEERKKCYPGVPWKKVGGIRNVLRHEYWQIRDEIIWNVYGKGYLRLLKDALRDMLENAGDAVAVSPGAKAKVDA
jgi:uncharacterized protein with HEPN domain